MSSHVWFIPSVVGGVSVLFGLVVLLAGPSWLSVRAAPDAVDDVGLRRFLGTCLVGFGLSSVGLGVLHETYGIPRFGWAVYLFALTLGTCYVLARAARYVEDATGDDAVERVERPERPERTPAADPDVDSSD